MPELPHWISPVNAVICRTRLVGRIAKPSKFKTGIVVVNGSGNTAHNEIAVLNIHLIDLNGSALETQMEILPFSAKIVWFHDCFPKINEFAPNGGSFLLTSSGVDANIQMITINTENFVSLQHLWGY